MARLTEDELKQILGRDYHPGINDEPGFAKRLWQRLRQLLRNTAPSQD